MIGCEVSEFLASFGKDVTIIEMAKRIALNVGPTSRWDVVKRVKRWGIKLLMSSKVVEIKEDGVILEDSEGTKTIKADTIVLALGMKSDTSLFDSLNRKISNLHTIGDCVKPARILEAIHSGYNVNRKF